jgi:hypothetical protein
MSKDIKLLLLAGVGIGFFAWALAYSNQFGTLVGSTTQGYGNVVKALEPPSGAGGFNPSGAITGTGYSGGSPIGVG